MLWWVWLNEQLRFDAADFIDGCRFDAVNVDQHGIKDVGSSRSGRVGLVNGERLGLEIMGLSV